jgi:hypothetical protein
MSGQFSVNACCAGFWEMASTCSQQRCWIGAARFPVGSGRNDGEDLSSHRSPDLGLQADCRWDDAAIDVPDDDNVFREQLELTPQERVRSTALLELLCHTSL